MRPTATIVLLVAQAAIARAEDAPRRTWGDSAAGVAHDAGRGVGGMLGWAARSADPKPVLDAGSGMPPVADRDPASQQPRIAESVQRTWGDTVQGWGLGAARGADWAYAKAWQGKEVAAPYASTALEATKGMGAAAWSGANAGIDAASPYAGAAWDATRRMSLTGYGMAAEGVRAGVDNMPMLIDWSADFAAAGATAFVSVGGSTLACGIATTPLAAVSAGAAYLVCIPVVAAGGHGGMQALRGLYGMYGRTPDEGAFAMGSIVGGLAGGTLANKGVVEFAQWRLRSQYGDFQNYTRAVRSLSEKNIRVWDPKVGLKRADGFHVDHVRSIKCGWTHGVSVAAISAARNFQYLPARENMSLGAKGC